MSEMIIVHLEDGIVQGLYVPADLIDTPAYVVDTDVEDLDEDNLLRFRGVDGKVARAYVRGLNSDQVGGDPELAVQAFLDSSLQLPVPVPKTYPVEFLIAFVGGSWDPIVKDVPVTVPESELRNWFTRAVLDKWQGDRQVAGFDVYHIGEPKEE